MKFIKKFQNDRFWNELENRLATRDFLRKHHESVIEKMSFEDKFIATENLKEAYHEEFCKYGLVQACF